MTLGDDDLMVRRLKRLHDEDTAQATEDLARFPLENAKPTMRASVFPILPLGLTLLIVGIASSVVFFSGGSRVGSTPLRSAGPTPTPTATVTATSIATAQDEGPEALIADLSAAGGTILQTGTFSAQRPFSVPGLLLCVEGRQVRVFVFPDARQREAAASQVDPNDPSKIGRSMIVEWIGQPRLWQRDRILVMYVGDQAATEDLLTSVLGPPFARGQGRTIVGRPPDTC